MVGGSGAVVGYVPRIVAELGISITDLVMKVSATGGVTNEDAEDFIPAFRKVARR